MTHSRRQFLQALLAAAAVPYVPKKFWDMGAAWRRREASGLVVPGDDLEVTWYDLGPSFLKGPLTTKFVCTGPLITLTADLDYKPIGAPPQAPGLSEDGGHR